MPYIMTRSRRGMARESHSASTYWFLCDLCGTRYSTNSGFTLREACRGAMRRYHAWREREGRANQAHSILTDDPTRVCVLCGGDIQRRAR